MQVYLNGEFLEQKKAAVSVADRGFVFGDGVYEVTRIINGKFFQEEEHLVRLDEGLKGLKINLNDELRHSIPEISRDLIKRNGHTEGEATVYLQITRGAAFPRTHTFPDPEVPPTIYLSSGPFKPHKELHERGVEVITVPDVRWTRCNLKTINLLPNTLAKQQAKEAGANSAIMIRDGVVTESPNANIFGVKDGKLFTFPASNYILNGITRRVVIDIANSNNIPLITEPVRQDDLYDMDELFFTGTTTDIQPIIKVDGRKIGSGKPGEVVRSIQKEYNNRLYG
ncbi:D-amino-acid transaminase [Rhodohalobacter sp.]|uniref:D-amino-acid transaminase n=1 Tax=Rhodohalobacter sp. TaxID=1974210 RepID=UPI002ACDA12E|nr:D-amino-acid transaminase [Rhodohalobacter sp.]MDZ7758053.1 D-amino-acid transaminase [Rhodohalobacter sp.]